MASADTAWPPSLVVPVAVVSVVSELSPLVWAVDGTAFDSGCMNFDWESPG